MELRKEYSQALCYKITGNIVVALDHTYKQQFVRAAHDSLTLGDPLCFVVIHLTKLPSQSLIKV